MNLLSVGGSDPSAGAGIQSDIRDFSSFGVHCLTVITAITSQNTTSFEMVEPVSQKILKNQLNSIISDFKIDGIKIGMVYNSEIMKTLHSFLKNFKIPIVVDPVIKSTTGGILIENKAIEIYKKFIIPLATVITPNEFEAKVLTKNRTSKKITIPEMSKAIQKMGVDNVVITGIETKSNQISDFVLEKEKQYFVSSQKIFKKNHGSGGNYSASLIFSLAKNNSIEDSVKFAKKITTESIKNAQPIGKGIPITKIQDKDGIKKELLDSINKFSKLKNIYKCIPECQTNFVYSKSNPKSIKDVLGVSGRIVKSGKEIMLAGGLEYGGSKHVATGLLVVNRKFPHIYSAINLKYESTTLSKIKKTDLTVSNYNRQQEPIKVKTKGSTVKWGIEEAIKNKSSPPDVIYHEGDFGKEPMILVFAENPEKVIAKILKFI